MMEGFADVAKVMYPTLAHCCAHKLSFLVDLGQPAATPFKAVVNL
jgi:hypothetical protein